MIQGLTKSASGIGVSEAQKWADYWYVLAFVLCIAVVAATFLLFMGNGWGLFQVPAAFSWPPLHVLNTALNPR